MVTVSNRGMALIAVLWITSLLALLAAGIGSGSRTVIRLAFNGLENTKARLAADAGVQLAIFDLLTAEGGRPWRTGGVLTDIADLEQTRVQVRIRDEDGKIDINAASPALLEGVFRAVDLAEDQAATLAAAVVDYRDDDSDLSPGGAEDPDYVAAGRPAGAADRPFRAVAELSDVLGVSEAIHDRVAPLFTIYSDAEGIDPLRASRPALAALPGMTPEALDAVLSLASAGPFEEDPFSSLPEALTAPFEDYLLPSRELVFEIQAIGESDGGGRFTREATIALDGGRDSLPLTVYAWQRGSR
jgi:general secretion pathway protein K